jgi:8-oxo-dGTP diphosphatase
MIMVKEYRRPSVTVDVTLFTYIRNGLRVLLIRRGNEPFAGKWALPGGFVDANEPLEMAAARELREETGMGDVYLEQLAAFGDPGRDPRGWVISVAYLALAGADVIAATRAGDDASDAAWFDIENLPSLAFDHELILSTAVHHMRQKLQYTLTGLQLLPSEFTLTDLQKVYETVLQTELDKRNFRRKCLSLDILEDTGRLQYGDYRPARLYRATATGADHKISRSPLP